MYQYTPIDKTDIVFKDTDDISNGAAYFYDNKICQDKDLNWCRGTK